jgi:hypothetical protein
MQNNVDEIIQMKKQGSQQLYKNCDKKTAVTDSA